MFILWFLLRTPGFHHILYIGFNQKKSEKEIGEIKKQKLMNKYVSQRCIPVRRTLYADVER